MTTASTKGVNHDGSDRLHAPSTNGKAGAHQLGDAPSTNEANGLPRSGDAPSTNEANGRDARGRFAKGNAGGPGNPFARRMARMRSVLCATVSEEDIEKVTRKLIEQAKGGDIAAARILLAYAVGQPTPAVDLDTLDAQEWQVFRQVPVPVAEVRNIMAGVPLDFACKIVRTLVPFLGEMAFAKARQVFNGEPEPPKKPERRRKRRKRAQAEKANQPEIAERQDWALRPIRTGGAPPAPPGAADMCRTGSTW
jgi:hypothetical protein